MAIATRGKKRAGGFYLKGIRSKGRTSNRKRTLTRRGRR